jgi:diacylglycerol kinase family enzyme
LNKKGNPFDGKFELVIVNYANAATLLRAGLSIFNENLIDIHNAQVIECSEALILLPEKKLLQLDGEIIGKVDEVHAKILKAAIRYINQKDVHHPKDRKKELKASL